MSDTIFDQTDQTVARQTNVAGDSVGRDKITVIGSDVEDVLTLASDCGLNT